MAIVDITTNDLIDDGNDSIVIIKNLEVIPGGRTLLIQGAVPDVIKAGHVIIERTADKELLPLALLVTEAIKTFGALTAGSGYTNDGTYTGVALTGGTGSGATADIVVTAGAVTSVTLVDAGTGYKVGDTLSAAAANIGTGGTGFAIAVATVSDAPSNTYGALPNGHTYKGILVASVLKSKPFASIMVRGSVNKVAAPYTIAGAVEVALPLIRFTQD